MQLNKFSLLVFVFLILKFNAQNFEGEIFFEINHVFHDSSRNNGRLPNNMKYIISGEFSKINQSTSIGSQTIIKDTLSKKSILLIKIMDDDIAIILENEKDTNEVVQITYKENFKTILNYKCQKAIVNTYNKLSEKNSTSVVYFTTEISNSYSNNFNQLLGFPLSYEINSDNITSTYYAKKIIKSIINPQEFEVSKYTKTFTLKEFKKLMN